MDWWEIEMEDRGQPVFDCHNRVAYVPIWPKLHQDESTLLWWRVWTLAFETEVDDQNFAKVEDELRNDEMWVELRQVAPSVVKMKVTTRPWSMEDYLIVAYRNIFGAVYRDVGRIITIEGQKLRAYAPFRESGGFEGWMAKQQKRG